MLMFNIATEHRYAEWTVTWGRCGESLYLWINMGKEEWCFLGRGLLWGMCTEI